jgi:hypothetical protein
MISGKDSSYCLTIFRQAVVDDRLNPTTKEESKVQTEITKTLTSRKNNIEYPPPPTVNPGDDEPDDPTPGEPVPGDPVPGEPVPGEPVPGEPVVGEPVVGEPVKTAADSDESATVEGDGEPGKVEGEDGPKDITLYGYGADSEYGNWSKITIKQTILGMQQGDKYAELFALAVGQSTLDYIYLSNMEDPGVRYNVFNVETTWEVTQTVDGVESTTKIVRSKQVKSAAIQAKSVDVDI